MKNKEITENAGVLILIVIILLIFLTVIIEVSYQKGYRDATFDSKQFTEYATSY